MIKLNNYKVWIHQTDRENISGLPSIGMEGDQYYAEQEYQYDYDDDTVVNDVDEAHIPSHRPAILGDSIVLDVDNGMTIRLPCTVDKLPGKQSNSLCLIQLAFILMVDCLLICCSRMIMNGLNLTVRN